MKQMGQATPPHKGGGAAGLCAAGENGYVCAMRSLPAPSFMLRFGLAAAVFGSLTGFAFAFWARQSDGIFLALVDAGLSWCF